MDSESPGAAAYSTESGRHSGTTLTDAARLWPTATAHERTHSPRAVDHGQQLANVAAKWPTPSASVAQDGEGSATWLARRETLKAKGINGNGAGMPLTIASVLWATPRTTSAKGARPDRLEGPDIQTEAARWAAPCARDYRTPNRDPQQHADQLANQVAHGPLAQQTPPDGASGSSVAVLHPSFVEALMGLPPSWTVPIVCDASAMRWFLFRQRSRLRRLLAGS